MFVAILFAFQMRSQTYGDFPYFETLSEGVQPVNIEVLSPQGDISNSASFTAQGLQLTDNVNNSFGAIYVDDKRFASANGIEIEFEFSMYGGSGADGIIKEIKRLRNLN